jgi:hypothetical protein
MDAVILEFVANTEGLKQAADQLHALGQISKEQYAQFQKANQDAQSALSKTTKAEQELNKAVQQGSKDAKGMSDAFRGLTATIAGEVIKEVVAEVTALGAEMQETAEKSKSLKTQLKELKADLAAMEQAGDDSSQTFINMSIEAAKLEDQIGDTNARIKAMASDTRAFDLVAEGVRGITAAFSAVTATQALFGEQNEDVQKALLKVQAAMALATSAQELANIATAKGGIATTAYGFALKGVDMVQKQLAISSAAAWGVITGGATIAIAAIVGLLYWLNKEAETEAQIADRKKKVAELEEMEKNKGVTAAENRVQALKNESNQRIASAKTTTEALKIQIELEQQLQREILARVNGIKAAAESVKKDFGEQNAQYISLRKTILENENAELESKERIKTLQQQLADEQKKQAEKALELSIRQLELKRAVEVKGSEDELALFKQVQDKKIELAKLNGAGSAEIRVMLAEQEQAYQEYWGNVLQGESAKDKAALAQLKTAREDELQFITDFFDHRLEIEGAFNTMSYDEFVEWEKKKRVEFKETADAKEKADKKAYDAEVKAGEDALKASQQAGEQKIALIQQAAETAIQIAQTVADTIFTIQQNNRDADLDAELTALDKRKDKELSNKNLTEAQKDAINEKYRKIEAAAKLKAWKADQDAAATQAGIKMALGVVNAWATSSSWIQALIVTAAVLAAGSASIAVIENQKPPQFAKGTSKSPPGFKWVGEEGPELINDGGGYAIMSHPDSMKLMEQYNIPSMPSYTPPMPNVSSDSVGRAISIQGNGSIDYDRLGNVIATKLKDNPRTVINIDKSGLSVHTIVKGNKIVHLNNYYAE